MFGKPSRWARFKERVIKHLWGVADAYVHARDTKVHEDTGQYYNATRGRVRVYHDSGHDYEECIINITAHWFLQLSWLSGDYWLNLRHRSYSWADLSMMGYDEY